MALVSLDGAKKKDTARFPDVQLLQHLLSCKVEMTPMQLELAQMDYEKLLEVLRCPMCYGRLARQDQILTCKACNGCYPIINGVPELYLEQPMEMQELLCLSKVSDITNISRMDRWIRKREKEFASTMRIKNTRLRLLLDRLAKLIERLNQYSSLHEKIGYVVHKLFGRSWKSEDPSAGF